VPDNVHGESREYLPFEMSGVGSKALERRVSYKWTSEAMLGHTGKMQGLRFSAGFETGNAGKQDRLDPRRRHGARAVRVVRWPGCRGERGVTYSRPTQMRPRGRRCDRAIRAGAGDPKLCVAGAACRAQAALRGSIERKRNPGVDVAPGQQVAMNYRGAPQARRAAAKRLTPRLIQKAAPRGLAQMGVPALCSKVV